MKDESQYTQQFTALIKKITKKHKAHELDAMEPTTQIISAFLQWNATAEQGHTAYNQLMEGLVDNNDLRVCLPFELIEKIGKTYPLADERICRLHETLHEIFRREHGIVIQSLKGKTKKMIKQYLMTLPGITPYVAAQTLLLSFGGHAFVMDDHTLTLFKEEKAVHPQATVVQAEAFAERHVKASDAVAVHVSVKAWADGHKLRLPTTSPLSMVPASAATLAPKTSTRKTTKKKG